MSVREKLASVEKDTKNDDSVSDQDKYRTEQSGKNAQPIHEISKRTGAVKAEAEAAKETKVRAENFIFRFTFTQDSVVVKVLRGREISWKTVSRGEATTWAF